MPDSACRADLGSKITSCISYTISGGLVVGHDLITVLDHHAAAIGAILGMCTFVINIYFQRKAMVCRCKILGVTGDHHPGNHPHRRADDINQRNRDEGVS